MSINTSPKRQRVNIDSTAKRQRVNEMTTPLNLCVRLNAALPDRFLDR
jgi:hypothetical protein